MIEQKLTYTAPEAEALVVRFEGVICTSPKPGQAGGDEGFNNQGNF